MRRALIAFATVSALVAACGGVEQEPNLAKAVERTEATGSARLELRASGMQDGEEIDVRCDGVADYAQERSRIECDLGVSEFEAIEIGNATYVHSSLDPLTRGRRWGKTSALGDSTALYAFTPERLLSTLRAASRETETVGEEEVRGEPTVRYRLIVDSEEAELIGAPGDTTEVHVWVDEEGIIRRIQAEEFPGVTGTIEFFDFGVDVEIEAPPANQVAQIGATLYPHDATPCATEPTPISESQALASLRRHGFTVKREGGLCEAGVAVVITNADREGVLEREGILHCFLHEQPPDGAPKTVVRRGTDGADAELLLANLDCTILADSPNAEEKIDPLEEAFDELQRAIRP